MGQKRFLKYWRYRERLLNKKVNRFWNEWFLEMMENAERIVWGLPYK